MSQDGASRPCLGTRLRSISHGLALLHTPVPSLPLPTDTLPRDCVHKLLCASSSPWPCQCYSRSTIPNAQSQKSIWLAQFSQCCPHWPVSTLPGRWARPCSSNRGVCGVVVRRGEDWLAPWSLPLGGHHGQPFCCCVHACPSSVGLSGPPPTCSTVYT